MWSLEHYPTSRDDVAEPALFDHAAVILWLRIGKEVMKNETIWLLMDHIEIHTYRQVHHGRERPVVACIAPSTLSTSSLALTSRSVPALATSKRIEEEEGEERKFPGEPKRTAWEGRGIMRP